MYMTIPIDMKTQYTRIRCKITRIWVRTDGDILRNDLTEKLKKKMFIWKTKNKMKKHSRKGYETSKWKCNNRLDRRRKK